MASEYKQYMDKIYGWEITIQGKSNDELNEIIELVNRLEAKGIVSYPHPKTEIVTCKDCKYRDPEDKFCDCGHKIKWSAPREDDFYCADGKRRE